MVGGRFAAKLLVGMLVVLAASCSTGTMIGNASAWSIHDPISIGGDGEFTGENGVVEGTGSPEDPYIIEGWQITDAAGQAIEIMDTTAHVVIRNMYLWSDSEQFACIKISNASNIEVTDSYLGTEGEIIGYPWAPVVHVENSSDVSVVDCRHTSGGGVRVLDSNNVTAQGNVFMAMSYSAISAVRSTNLTICENRLDAGDRYEVSLNDCKNCTVSRNNLGSYGAGLGFRVDSSVNISVFHNNIACWNADFDDHTMTSDCPEELNLDNGYPDGGNYWEKYSGVDEYTGLDQDILGEDGIGDSEFVIGDDVDRYPLMFAVEWYTPELQQISAWFDTNYPELGTNMDLTAAGSDQFGYQFYDMEVSWSIDNERALVVVDESDSSHAVFVPLQVGMCNLTVSSDGISGIHQFEITPDVTPPVLVISAPEDGHVTGQSVVTVSGSTEAGAVLQIASFLIVVDVDGAFSCPIALNEGVNNIMATATDASNNSITVTREVTYVNPIYDLLDELNETQDDLDEIQEELAATQNDLEETLETLIETMEELNSTREALEIVEDDLAATNESLNTTVDMLEDALADLAQVDEDLLNANDELDDKKTMTNVPVATVAALVAFALIALLMIIILRKRMSKMMCKEEENRPDT